MLPDLVRFSVKARNQDSKVMSAEILMSTHYKKKKKKINALWTKQKHVCGLAMVPRTD